MIETGSAPFIRTNLATSAILLDVDGTLLDIAETPDLVHVPSELREVLRTLLQRSSGAVALVSGRSIGDLDRIFHPLKFPAIGCHGAELREDPAAPIRTKAPLSENVKLCLGAVSDPSRGILLEDKHYTVALHYRKAPQAREQLERAVRDCVSRSDTPDIEVLDGKAVFEIKPSSFNKGSAVRDLMQRAPFQGRLPVFIGDDVTDESVFGELKRFKGIGIAVGNRIRGADHVMRSPSDVRRWLASVAGHAEFPDTESKGDNP